MGVHILNPSSQPGIDIRQSVDHTCHRCGKCIDSGSLRPTFQIHNLVDVLDDILFIIFYLHLLHIAPVYPGLQTQRPVRGSQLMPPSPHTHRFLHPSPKVPLGQRSSHVSPKYPDRHVHTPVTWLQWLPLFPQLHVLLQACPQYPSGQGRSQCVPCHPAAHEHAPLAVSHFASCSHKHF